MVRKSVKRAWKYLISPSRIVEYACCVTLSRILIILNFGITPAIIAADIISKQEGCITISTAILVGYAFTALGWAANEIWKQRDNIKCL